MEKLDLRTASKETKEAIRLRAIRLLKEGKTLKEVASLLCVNKNSVYTWNKNFNLSGYKGLKEKQQGHKIGLGRLLTSEQAKQEKAAIHWGDETGVKNECQYGRSYAPRGKTPTRTKMGKRLSLNMISNTRVLNMQLNYIMNDISRVNTSLVNTFTGAN